MKTLSKILLAVWFLGAVDANAELKRFTYLSKAIPGKTQNDISEVNNILEIKSDEVLVPIRLLSYGVIQPLVVYPDGSQYQDFMAADNQKITIIGPALKELHHRYKLDRKQSTIFD